MVARRTFMKGFAAGLPLASILASPLMTRAAADRLETVSITKPDGNTVSAALARPTQENAPALLVIHEWWGLNDQIKAVTHQFAQEGYLALAVDLYGGQVGTTPDEARSLMQAVDAAEGTATMTAWADWLKSQEGASGRIGSVGWCFGGGWSLNTSIATAIDATVIYYGNVSHDTAQLAKLQGPVQGHFATQDKWINQAMVDGFVANMQAAGKSLETHWYEADHAFANPSGQRYDEEDAQLAWSRSMDFFGQHLAS